MLDCPQSPIHCSVQTHIGLTHIQQLLLVILLLATTSWSQYENKIGLQVAMLSHLDTRHSRLELCRREYEAEQRRLRIQQDLVLSTSAPVSETPCLLSPQMWWPNLYTPCQDQHRGSHWLILIHQTCLPQVLWSEVVFYFSFLVIHLNRSKCYLDWII